MKIAKLTAGILLGVLTAYACGGMSTQAGGSNTNWFATCTASSDCGGTGLECWCGICTKTCGDDCAATAGATCSAPPPSCSNPSEPAKEKACAVQCTKDADCKDVASDATCVQSICRRPAVTTHRDSGAPLTCDELTSRAQAALQVLRDQADQTCNVDADCTDFPEVSCTNHCETTTVSTTDLAATQGKVDDVERNICSQFQRQGCTALEPPCAFPGLLGCVSHKCQRFIPGAQLDGGTCNSQADHIHNTLLDALDALDKSCKGDADCTRVQPELSCEGGCPFDASNTSAAAFVAMRAGFERDLCGPYNAEGCSPVITGCPLTPGEPPKCLKGVCTDVFMTTTGSDAGPSSCGERTAQMQAELQSVVDAADKKCAVAADCTAVTLANSCLESCTVDPVSAAGGKSIRDELDAIDSTSCGAFTQAGCTAMRLPCPTLPTGSPGCKSGVCSW